MAIGIAVRNFAGVDRADIAVSKIALLAGMNHQGKTSVCRAIGAAIAGRPIPIEGVKKAEAGALVRTGTAEGSVKVTSESGNGIVTVKWPSALRETSGAPVEASAYAVGLASILDLDAKERATALAPYLKAEPTHADMETALKDAEIDPELRNRVWGKVAKDGWDPTHTMAKDNGAKLKGQWETITGDNYGADKAKRWLPAAWRDALAALSEETLQKEVVQARSALEEAIAGAAVDQATLARLREQAEKLEALETELLTVQKAADEAEFEHQGKVSARNALPPADTSEGALPCPHCDKPIRLQQAGLGTFELVKAGEKLKADEIKKRRLAIASADGEVKHRADELGRQRTRLTALNAEIPTARRAADQLRNAEGRSGDAGAVDKARAILATAEADLAAYLAKTQADRKCESIRQNQAIVAALAPDGLRKQALARGLEAFNERLGELCDKAGWNPVGIEPDLLARYGGRPYPLCSGSEQWRVRAVLAVAMAQIDGSQLVILDGADILDQVGRNGLVRMLVATELPALVAMTISDPKLMPDLAKGGLGESYWIDGGIVRPLAETRETVKAA